MPSLGQLMQDLAIATEHSQRRRSETLKDINRSDLIVVSLALADQ